MDTRNLKIRRVMAMTLTAAVVLLAALLLSARTSQAATDDGKNDDDKPNITVEVVEDIPAADIEEQQVPLADSPATAAADGTRHMVIAWTLGAVVIAYAVFILTGMRRRASRRQVRTGTHEGVLEADHEDR